jgi:hypothetical protein
MRASAFAFAFVALGSLVACSSSSHPGLVTPLDSGEGPLDTGLDAVADASEVGSHCTNLKKDSDETDVDCGGSCGGCITGRKCAVNADCIDLACAAGTCVTPSCTDKVMDGTETDVDCGGPSCSPCADGLKCTTNENCKSLVCSSGKCQAPSCTDKVRNGSESDQDCGGSCPACTVGKRCGGVADCGSHICDATVCGCPLGMVIMPTKALGGGAYCIDAHEVTNSAYNTFWTAAVSAATQPSYCQWNSNWTPSQSWPPAAGDAMPVRYVDWCDAYAYCKWNGKTLCGKIGGGANAAPDLKDPLKSAWFNACSAQATNDYPTGSSFATMACNGGGKPDVWSTGTASCQGGATGLYDMSGNVQEWEDSCSSSTGDTDDCRARGGAFDTVDTTLLRCDAPTTLKRNTQSADLGFRCCAFY